MIFLTTSKKRLAGMIDVVRRVDPRGRGSHFFQFAPLEDCRIATHEALSYEPLSRSSKVGYDNRRTLFLDVCSTCNQSVDPANEAYRLLNSVPPAWSSLPAPRTYPPTCQRTRSPSTRTTSAPGSRRPETERSLAGIPCPDFRNHTIP